MQTNGETDDEDNDDEDVEDVSPSQLPHPTAIPPAELMTTLQGIMSSSMDDLLKNVVDASSCLVGETQWFGKCSNFNTNRYSN